MNYSRFADPAYDKLMNQANAETDLAARAKLLEAAELILLKGCVVMPENFGHYHRLVKPYVTGFEDNFNNIHPLRFMNVDRPKS